jgi:hypothetical protein
MPQFLLYLLRFSIKLGIWSFILFCLFAALVSYFSTPEGNAFIFRTLVKFLPQSVIKEFQLGRISFIPFFMDDFACHLAGTATSPEAVASFTKLQIFVDLSSLVDPRRYIHRLVNFFQPQAQQKLQEETPAVIRFDFTNFYASSPSIQFKDFLGSSPKTNDSLYTKKIDPKKYIPVVKSSPFVTSMKKLGASVAKLVDFNFNSIKFDFLMPVNGCEIHGKCEKMLLQFKDSKTLGSNGLKIFNHISKGEVIIIDEQIKAFEYRGEKAKFCVDFYLPAGMMDVMVFLYGQKDFAWVNLFPFLQFYIKYQAAEDKALEQKLSMGRSSASKMNMGCELDFMKIEVVDHRITSGPPLIVLMRKCRFEMMSFPLTKSKKKTLKGQLCLDEIDYDPIEGCFLPKTVKLKEEMSPNALKMMTAIVEKVSFHLNDLWNGNNEIENIEASKTLFVNHENSFLDEDLMEAKIERIFFDNMDSLLLDWMIIMQDASNRMPSSRWAHQKNVVMDVLISTLRFSTKPMHFNYDLLTFKNLMQKIEIPLTAMPLDENRTVSFVFKDYHIDMKKQHNSTDSLWKLKSKLFEMRTSLPTIDLEAQYHISLLSTGGKDEDIFPFSTRFPSDDSDHEDDRRMQFKSQRSSRPFALGRQKGVKSTEIFPRSSGPPVPLGRQKAMKSIDAFRVSNDPQETFSSPSNPNNPKKVIFQNRMENIEKNNPSISFSQSQSFYQHPNHSINNNNNNLRGSFDIDPNLSDSRRSRSYGIGAGLGLGLGQNDRTILTPGTTGQQSEGSESLATTGTVWKFESFEVVFSLSPTSMALQTFYSKHFLIDFLNSFPNPGLGFGRRQTEEEYFHYRDNFLSIIDLQTSWSGPTDINCKLGPTHSNCSTAGALKVLCAFGMIRKTADRMFGRMEAIKNRFIPLEILAKSGKLSSPATPAPPPPPPQAGKTIIHAIDLTFVIAVQHESTRMTRNAIECIQQQQTVPFSSSALPAALQTSSNEKKQVSFSDSLNGQSEKGLNKCIIMKLQNLVGEMGPDIQLMRFSSGEMILNHFSVSPFLTIEEFSYEKRLAITQIATSDHRTGKPVLINHVVSSSLKASVTELLFHFHPLMELGE